MNFTAPNLMPEEGPDPVGQLAGSLHETMMLVRGDINRMVERELEKILGRAVLDLYAESRDRVPGVELIVNQTGNPPGRITIKATLKFRDEILTEETYILEMNKI